LPHPPSASERTSTSPRGRTDSARQVLESALELPYYRGNTNHQLSLLSSLSSLELIEGDAAEALAVAERALGLARGTNDRFALPSVLYHLAQASLVLGDLDHAADYIEQADLREREVRPPTETSAFLEEIRLTRAAIAAARGNIALAESERETALQFFADHDLSVTGTDRRLVDLYLTRLITHPHHSLVPFTSPVIPAAEPSAPREGKSRSPGPVFRNDP